jgi:8-oxo-dGTP diphosphatase
MDGMSADSVAAEGEWIKLSKTGCQSTNHRGWRSIDHFFRCNRCRRVTCAECEGGLDQHPELCDFCWQFEARRAEAEPAICVAALVADEYYRVLLIRHRKRGTWELPGGKKLPNETWAAAIVREVQEETGLSVAVYASSGMVAALDAPSASVPGAIRTVIVANAHLTGTAPVPDPVAGDDAAEARWFDCDDIPWDLMSPFPSTQCLREWI